MNTRIGPSSIRVGTANDMRFAKFLLAQSKSFPEAMVRFMAGPPMTERDWSRQNAAEARIRESRVFPH